MNILITGACGQLGREISALANSCANVRHRYICTDIEEYDGVAPLDICNRANVLDFVQKNGIDCIINCAAYTNVDKAENDYTLAEMLNATAVRNLADAMADCGGLLVHISTDYVFGGNDFCTPIAEDAPQNPTGIYGLTKLHGEQQILQSGCRNIILRTSWLYSVHGKNFMKTMIALTASRPELNVVVDQAGTPTCASDLAMAIFTILEDEKYAGNEGIYHYSNEGVCSWFDFTVTIAKMCGHTDCKIRPCRSDEFPSPVVRPSYSVLDKTKFKKVFNIEIPYWTDSLSKCIEASTKL